MGRPLKYSTGYYRIEKLRNHRWANRESSKPSGFSGLPGRKRSGTRLCWRPWRARERDNIEEDEVKEFKEAAKHVLALTEKQLAALVRKGDFVEVKHE